MADGDVVYGVWDGDELVAVGTERQIHGSIRARHHVRVLTPENDGRRPNKWRDIAAASLRDRAGLDYEEIAELLQITVGMAQGAVSRVRCGRYSSERA